MTKQKFFELLKMKEKYNGCVEIYNFYNQKYKHCICVREDVELYNPYDYFRRYHVIYGTNSEYKLEQNMIKYLSWEYDFRMAKARRKRRGW